ncbi:hypothetical protein Tco_0315523 [Tanacetum coccineum]
MEFCSMIELRVKGSRKDPSIKTQLIVVRRKRKRLSLSIGWKRRKLVNGEGGEKVVKRELLVALKGELYFFKFIINPEEDNVEPRMIFGRSFLRLTKGLVDFGNMILTIYPDLTTFEDESDDELEANLSSVDLDGEFEVEKEITGEDFIKGYKAIREKNDQRVFVLPIRLEGNYERHALVDTGSNINVMPYRIYESLRRDQVKPINKKRSLCLTTLKRNPLEGTTTTFDGVCHQKFYVVKVQNAHGESDSDDNEEYCLKKDEIGKAHGNCNRTFKSRYNTNLARILPKQVYLPCIVDWTMLNTLVCGDVIEDMSEIKVYEMGGDQKLFTFEAWRRAFDINEPIYAELCHEFYATFEFDDLCLMMD